MAGSANDLTRHKLLRLKDVLCRTGLSRSGVYRLMAENLFPRQVELGERSRAWVEQEVNDWISNRIEMRNGNGGRNGHV